MNRTRRKQHRIDLARNPAARRAWVDAMKALNDAMDDVRTVGDLVVARQECPELDHVESLERASLRLEDAMNAIIEYRAALDAPPRLRLVR